jgi:hypothetical protein
VRARRLLPVLAIAAAAIAAGCDDSGQQAAGGADRVTICHATASSNNPFNELRVSKDGAVSGHDNHPNDIIPPFDYLDNDGTSQHYPGKNWTGEGQAIHDNGCKPVDSTTEPTTTTSVSTDAPPTSETEGTGEGVTTQPPSPSTDAPPTSEPAGTGEAVTTAPAESTTVPSGGSEPPGTQTIPTVDPNQVTTSASVPPVAPGTGGGDGPATAATTAVGGATGAAGATGSPPDTSLSDTGTNSRSLAWIGGCAVLVGAIALLARRTSARRP